MTEGVNEGEFVDGDNVGIADGIEVGVHVGCIVDGVDDGVIVIGSAEGGALGAKLENRWCKMSQCLCRANISLGIYLGELVAVNMVTLRIRLLSLSMMYTLPNRREE